MYPKIYLSKAPPNSSFGLETDWNRFHRPNNIDMNFPVELEFATWINPLSSLAEKKSLYLAACKMKFICVSYDYIVFVFILLLQPTMFVYCPLSLSPDHCCLMSTLLPLVHSYLIIVTIGDTWWMSKSLSKSLSSDNCHLIIVSQLAIVRSLMSP